MDNLLTLLGNYAFPIVCCAALFWKMDKDQKLTQEYMHERDELHRDEINSLRASFDENTKALVKLLAFLKKGVDEND